MNAFRDFRLGYFSILRHLFTIYSIFPWFVSESISQPKDVNQSSFMNFIFERFHPIKSIISSIFGVNANSGSFVTDRFDNRVLAQMQFMLNYCTQRRNCMSIIFKFCLKWNFHHFELVSWWQSSQLKTLNCISNIMSIWIYWNLIFLTWSCFVLVSKVHT